MAEEFKLEDKIKDLKKLKEAIDEVLISIEKKSSRNSLYETKGAEVLKAKQDARIAADMDELKDLLSLIDIHIIDNAGVRAELIANGSQELNDAIRALTDQAFRDAIKQHSGLEVETKSGKVMEELDKLEGKEFKFKGVEEQYKDIVKREADLSKEIVDIEAYEKVRANYSKEEIKDSIEGTPRALAEAKAMLEEAKKVKGINVDAIKIEELFSELDNVPTDDQARIHSDKKPSKTVRENRDKYNAYVKKLKVALTELKKIAEINPEVAGLVEKLEKKGIKLTPDSKKLMLKDRKVLKSVLETLKGYDYKAMTDEFITTKTQDAYGKVSDIIENSPILLLQAEETRTAALAALKKAEENGEPIPEEITKLIETAAKDERLGKIDSLEKGMGEKGSKYKELAELRARMAKLKDYKTEKRVVDTTKIRIAGKEVGNITVKKGDKELPVDFDKFEGYKPESKEAIYNELMLDPDIQRSLAQRYEAQFKTNKLFAGIRNFFHKLLTGKSHEEAKKRIILESMVKDSIDNRKADKKAEEDKKVWELDDTTKTKIQQKQQELGKNATMAARTAVVEKGKTAEEAFAEQQTRIENEEGLEL